MIEARLARIAARIAVIAATAALGVGCESSLPVPPIGPHTRDTFVLVPYPPPPARVEIIPVPPTRAVDMVWLDGEWQWKGRRWVWNGGLWQLPQPGAYYALSMTVRLSDGSLAWFPGRWEIDPANR